MGSPQASVADTKHQADTPEKKLYQADKDAAIDGFPSVTPGLKVVRGKGYSPRKD